MAVHVVSRGDRASVPRPELHVAGWITVALLGLLGLGAIGGGIFLVASPDGSLMQWDVSMLAGSPFPDFLVPGLILGGVFGIGSFTVALMGLRRVRLAPFLAFGVGVGQMIWISVELAIIGEFSFLHPACFALGLGIAGAALTWGWPTWRAWRSIAR